MKPIAVMIAALSLVTTSWAQGDHTSNGRRSKPMQTVNDSRMVAPALEKYAQGLLRNYGNARASRHGTAASLPSPP